MRKENGLDKILKKKYDIPEEMEKLADDLAGGWWNYRLIEKENRWKDKTGKEYFEKYFEIHEVYYREDGEIWAWSENPMSIYFEDYKEIGQLIKQIKNATKKPVLRLVKDDKGEEELVPVMKTLKQYKETELSNWDTKDFWKDVENETRRK